MHKRKRNSSRFLHKWVSIVLTVFILVFVVSGIVLNHRGLFSGVDVPRKYLLQDYRYRNWNNAAIRGSCLLDSDRLLVYGNIGVWLTDNSLQNFQDFNDGFPKGIDNRKIFKIVKTPDQGLYAGTLFGLYRWPKEGRSWEFVDLPLDDPRVVDLLVHNGKLLLLSRSFVYELDPLDPTAFKVHTLPPPLGYDNKVGLFKTLWVIHSGEIAHGPGKLFVDLMGLLFAFLSITGIVYWLFPKWIRQRKRSHHKIVVLKAIRNFSLRWHNRIGVYAVFFMLITTLTGMFLRPPLLIAIANARIEKIPFTLLADPNPWNDQLRRIVYDSTSRSFVIGSTRGIYRADENFHDRLIPYASQPPISVMGINVLEHTENNNLLVGSFNGLFLWNPEKGELTDYYNPGHPVRINPMGPPLGEHLTAGYVRLPSGTEYVFDYNRGVESQAGSPLFPEMSRSVRESSPLSLWNLALEFHTGRYYSVLFGSLYILFIPLFGIFMLASLITGFIVWWKMYR